MDTPYKSELETVQTLARIYFRRRITPHVSRRRGATHRESRKRACSGRFDVVVSRRLRFSCEFRQSNRVLHRSLFRRVEPH